jgi:hypothetical protein
MDSPRRDSIKVDTGSFVSPKVDKDILKKRRGSRPLSVTPFTPQKKTTPVQVLLGPIEQELKRRKELIATREDENRKLQEEMKTISKKLETVEKEKTCLIAGLKNTNNSAMQIGSETKRVFNEVEVKNNELKSSLSASLIKYQRAYKAREESRTEKNRTIIRKLRELKENVVKYRKELKRMSSDYKDSLKLFAKGSQANRMDIVFQLKKRIEM